MRSCNWTIIFLILFLGLPLLSGCAEQPDSSDSQWVVSVSLPPQAFLLERIAGPDVKIQTLVHGGESPATYQPSDRQVSDVLRSDLYFRLGVPFERGRWFEAIRNSKTSMKVVDLRQGITLRRFSGCGHAEHAMDSAELGSLADAGEASGDHVHDETCDHEDHDPAMETTESAVHDPSNESTDPHTWLSPASLITMSKTITQALCDLNPDQSDRYRSRQQTLQAELIALNEELKALLAPHAGKRFYIYHPAWGYFCDAYGLEQVAIEFEGKEPSDEELSRIQEKMRADAARVIFMQPQIAGKSVEAVADAVGVEVKILDPLARDVIQNLRHAAQTIAGSFE